MIRITNGTTNKTVTKGAYEDFYKPLGYDIVDTGNKKSKREVEIKEEKNTKELFEKDSKDKGEKKSQKIEEIKKR